MRFLVAVVLALAAFSASAHRCIDGNGRTVYQDTGCGTTESPAQKEAREEEEQKKIAAAIAEHDRQRRLHMFLRIYPSPDDLEAARQRELRKQGGPRRRADAREAELRQRLAMLKQEAEFYTPLHKPLPADLKRKFDEVDAELTAQMQARQNLDHEDSITNAKYDGWRSDLQPLWHPMPARTAKK